MSKLLRRTLIVIGSLLGLVAVALAIVYFGSQVRINKTYEVAVKPINFYSDSITLAEGRYLGTAVAKCVDCHGDDLGGKAFIPQGPLGQVDAPNITTGAGSVVKNFKNEDWVRAIRHGISPEGRPLWIMPATEFQNLSGEEINAIVSWVRSVPPVDRTMDVRELTMLGRALVVMGKVPLLAAEDVNHEAPLPAAPKAEATIDYGRHMALTGGCVGCHGETFVGGEIPGAPPDWPPARNITPDPKAGIGSWTEQDFFHALRDGRRPNGDTISGVMPWRYTAQLKDVAIKALFMYLRTLPARVASGS